MWKCPEQLTPELIIVDLKLYTEVVYMLHAIGLRGVGQGIGPQLWRVAVDVHGLTCMPRHIHNPRRANTGSASSRAMPFSRTERVSPLVIGNFRDACSLYVRADIR